MFDWLARFESYFHSCAQILRLFNYRFSFGLAHPSKSDILSISVHDTSRQATVTLYPAWFALNEQEKAQAVAHELVHVYFHHPVEGALEAVPAKDRKTVRRSIIKFEELSVDELAWVLEPLMPRWID